MLEPGGLAIGIWAVLQFLIFAVPIGVVYVGWRFLRAYEKRAVGGRERAALEERVLSLEDTVRSLTQQIEHLGEQQRFTTRLLGERTNGVDAGAP
jgi:hypothetical protein